jgi:predicted TPR repeat methyltransferase
MEIVRGDWSSFAGSQQCPPSSLDFVTAFDVFEHLPLLSRDVALIHGILKEGGLLFASVPNVESLIAKVLGGRWNMMLLEHLWYFSPDTARRFLEPLGFKEVRTLGMPYDAPIRHILTRAAQVFGREGEISIPLISNLVLPVPAGVMLLIYRKV